MTNTATELEPRTDVKLKLSIGLLFCVLLHSASQSFFESTIPPMLEQRVQSMPPDIPAGGLRFQSREAGGVGSTVNTAARDEMKQQQPYCIPCDQLQNPARPIPQLMPQPAKPNTPQSLKVTTGKGVEPKYSISLFLRANDALSNQLLGYFNNDPKYTSFVKTCNFQVYTKDSPLYQTRYASIVPVEAFPAMLVTDPNGGHVHLIDRSTIPTTAPLLWADISEAVRLQKAIVSKVPAAPAPPPGLPASVGLSAPDTGIGSNANCPDGNCPVDANRDRTTLWDKLFKRDQNNGGLFPHDLPDPVEGMLKMIFRPGEILSGFAMVVVAICATVATVYALKRK
jgi:hypothetical protein